MLRDEISIPLGKETISKTKRRHLQDFGDSLKDFGFKDQITRSGLSIPSNIAEGSERETNKERANFLNYAKGSAGELRTQIYIGMDISYIDSKQGKEWINETEEISKMLYGLIKSIKAKIH